jgi:hypothetical protein
MEGTTEKALQLIMPLKLIYHDSIFVAAFAAFLFKKLDVTDYLFSGLCYKNIFMIISDDRKRCLYYKCFSLC